MPRPPGPEVVSAHWSHSGPDLEWPELARALPRVASTSLWGASCWGRARSEAWSGLAGRRNKDTEHDKLQKCLPGLVIPISVRARQKCLQVIPSSIRARLPGDGRAAGHNIKPQATAEARPCAGCAPAPATIVLHSLRIAHALRRCAKYHALLESWPGLQAGCSVDGGSFSMKEPHTRSPQRV